MDVLRQIFSVLLVFTLLGAVLWLLRRGGRISFQGFTARGIARTRVQGNTRSMVAVERLALTPQHTLHMVRVHGREVLVATHPQGCSLVTTVTEQAMGAKA
jgi:flagellar biosynthesis protein FliO